MFRCKKKDLNLNIHPINTKIYELKVRGHCFFWLFSKSNLLSNFRLFFKKILHNLYIIFTKKIKIFCFLYLEKAIVESTQNLLKFTYNLSKYFKNVEYLILVSLIYYFLNY